MNSYIVLDKLDIDILDIYKYIYFIIYHHLLIWFHFYPLATQTYYMQTHHDHEMMFSIANQNTGRLKPTSVRSYQKLEHVPFGLPFPLPHVSIVHLLKSGPPRVGLL